MSRLAKTLDLIARNRVQWAIRPNIRRQIARRAKERVVELGPTFVKIGQYVSTRGDVFPEEIIDEFVELQDNVMPMEWKQIEPIVSNVNDLSMICTEPMASASLGQVHRAQYNGLPCVIKILRPEAKEQLQDDVENLKIISKIFRIFNPTGSSDIEMFVEELESMLKMETDYEGEAKNTEIFSRNFRNIDWVIVPQVYYSSPDVIVMEYIPSTKITEVTKYDKKSLTWALTKSQIIQVLETGFFHGDPHPGNVGINNGKIVYYDFGLVSEISIKQKNTLIALLIAITSENEDQILAILNNLGLVSKDPTGLRKFVRFFLDYIQKNDISDPEQVKELVAIQNNPVKFSGSFFYLMRSFALIEGISKQLDPSYSSSKMLQKYVSEADVMEDAVVTSIRNTFSDISGVSYRLSSIEKRVRNDQRRTEERDLFIIFVLLILLLENYGIIGWIA